MRILVTKSTGLKIEIDIGIIQRVDPVTIPRRCPQYTRTKITLTRMPPIFVMESPTQVRGQIALGRVLDPIVKGLDWIFKREAR